MNNGWWRSEPVCLFPYLLASVQIRAMCSINRSQLSGDKQHLLSHLSIIWHVTSNVSGRNYGPFSEVLSSFDLAQLWLHSYYRPRTKYKGKVMLSVCLSGHRGGGVLPGPISGLASGPVQGVTPWCRLRSCFWFCLVGYHRVRTMELLLDRTADTPRQDSGVPPTYPNSDRTGGSLQDRIEPPRHSTPLVVHPSLSCSWTSLFLIKLRWH